MEYCERWETEQEIRHLCASVFCSISSPRLLLLMIYFYVMFCFNVVLFYYFISVLLG